MSSNYEKVKEESPCWNCGNACGGCSWSRDFVPVPGWDADANILADGTMRGYTIRYCPEQIPDDHESFKCREIDTGGMMALLEAMAAGIRDDYVNGKGPYDANKQHGKQMTPGEIRTANRNYIEKFIRSERGRALLELSSPDEVINRLRQLARRHDTDLVKVPQNTFRGGR